MTGYAASGKRIMDRIIDRTVQCCNGLWKYSPSAKTAIFFGSWLTWMFSILSLSKCRFVAIGDGTYVGLFSRPFIDENGSDLGCIRYSSSDTFDSMFAAGRALGMIALVSVSFCLVMISAVFVWGPRDKELLWSLARYTCAFATITQMFMFLVLGSGRCEQYGCSLSRDGVLAVFNTLFLAALSIILFIETAPSIPWISWSRKEEEIIESYAEGTNIHTIVETNPAVMDLSMQGSRIRSRIPTLEAIQEVDSVDPENEISVVVHDNNNNTSNNQYTDVVDFEELQSMRWFRLSTVVLLALTWSMIISAVRRCQLILLTESDGSNDIYAGLGLFSQTVEKNGVILGCVSYPLHTIQKFDSSFRAGRCFGTISAFLMTIILLLSFRQLFDCHIAPKTWIYIKFILPCTFVSQLLSFSAFGTEACHQLRLAECRIGGTGVVAILCVLLLLKLCILFRFVPPPTDPVFVLSPEITDYAVSLVTAIKEQLKNKDRQTLTAYQEPARSTRDQKYLQSERGSSPTGELVESMSVQVVFTEREKKTIKTLYHSDGSQTITTTVEELFDCEDTDSCSDGECSVDTH